MALTDCPITTHVERPARVLQGEIEICGGVQDMGIPEDFEMLWQINESGPYRLTVSACIDGEARRCLLLLLHIQTAADVLGPCQIRPMDLSEKQRGEFQLWRPFRHQHMT